MAKLVFGPRPTHKESPVITEDGDVDSLAIMEHFRSRACLDNASAAALVRRAHHLLALEDNMLKLKAPLVVLGDLHGQFYDMVALVDSVGAPCRERPWLLMGDYVDRGNYSCEIMLTLFAWKVSDPDSIFLLRGNHESRASDAPFNFRRECESKYSKEVFEMFQRAFDALPLAAVVDSPSGRLFCVHGGIGPQLTKLEQIDALDRFQEPPLEGVMCDMLWSDPVPREYASVAKEWRRIEFAHNAARGCSYFVGDAPILRFARQNNIRTILRAHECVEEGFQYNVVEGEDPRMITVFSAPNYCGTHRNMGGYAIVGERLHLYQFSTSTSHLSSASGIILTSRSEMKAVEAPVMHGGPPSPKFVSSRDGPVPVRSVDTDSDSSTTESPQLRPDSNPVVINRANVFRLGRWRSEGSLPRLPSTLEEEEDEEAPVPIRRRQPLSESVRALRVRSFQRLSPGPPSTMARWKEPQSMMKNVPEDEEDGGE